MVVLTLTNRTFMMFDAVVDADCKWTYAGVELVAMRKTLLVPAVRLLKATFA